MSPTDPFTCQAHDHHVAVNPTAILRREHEVILRALRVIERIGQDLDARHAVDRSALTCLIEFFRIFADRRHHGKEEQHLFPALELYGIPRQGGPLSVMLREHEEGRALLRDMVQGDDHRIAEAIGDYSALLRAHIDKENRVLFPLAEQVLPAEQQRALVQAFEAVERTAADADVYERLLAQLARLEEAGFGSDKT